jgi:non-lysosomal glucosylceramidase
MRGQTHTLTRQILPESFMKAQIRRHAILWLILVILTPAACGADDIPKAAWKRPIGLPLTDAGTKKTSLPPDHIDDGFWQGAPVGGFGSGTFSRTYRGDFARWHMKAGVHKYQTVYANQFAMFQKTDGESDGVAKVLFTDHPRGADLKSWAWNYPVGAGNYSALYPKSWFDYQWDKFPAHVTIEQFSPILPDNYKETSYPVAVYRVHAENPTNRNITVSVLLSWSNMLGWFSSHSHDLSGALNEGNHNLYVSKSMGAAGTMKGIVFDRDRAGAAENEWDGQWMIAALEAQGVEVSYQTTFLTNGDGSEVWKPFAKDGRLADDDQQWVSSGERLAGAIAIRFTLHPAEKRIIPMVIAWDMPVAEFGGGRKWYRRYTDFYGTSGKNVISIATDGLLNSDAWSKAIDSWQAGTVNDESKPLWYRGMLFNELYDLADGGTFWGRPIGSDAKTPSTFGYMECFDYPYYATLDVLFYGSMPLVKFWPEIDKRILREFADTVPREITQKNIWVWKTQQTKELNLRVRKNKGAVPHDLGVPHEDPFFLVNHFNWQDTNGWKDLNSKFVLMVYRDFVLTGGKDFEFLRYEWPAVKDAIAYLGQFDHGSGTPEGGGYPDQTYDTWLVRGVSAYSGGLWLGALRASEEMARIMGESNASSLYHQMFLRGQKSYVERLWNGEYFRYDTDSEYRDNIQADQLAGQWYADIIGLGDLVPQEMRQTALRKIYDFNVRKFANGEMGAVNGIAPDGSIVQTNEQVQEVWTGTTFGLAGLMLSEGMEDEAYRTAWGIYHVVYETKGYWFRTPEAWDITGNYRASMYMRPGAIWALELARSLKKN